MDGRKPLDRRRRRRRWVVVFLCAIAEATALAPPKSLGKRVIATNKKAGFQYEILRKYEAGIELVGTEVKACRAGKVQLRDAFARVRKNTVWLHNADIAPHKTTGQYFNHEPKRERRLLMHKSEAKKLKQEMQLNNGYTLVPLSFYFNEKNMLKVNLALCRGKNTRDKRQDIRARDEKRELNRISKVGR